MCRILVNIARDTDTPITDSAVRQTGIIIRQVHAAAIRVALHIVISTDKNIGPHIMELVKDNDCPKVTEMYHISFVNWIVIDIIKTCKTTLNIPLPI